MNTELIARLEAAEVGGRDFDGEVAAETVGWMEHDGSSVTTSLDAALALAKRVLPSAYIGIQQNRGVGVGSSWSAYVEYYDKSVEAMESIESDSHIPSLALCIAILRALDQGEEK